MQSENAPAESDLRLEGLMVTSPQLRRSPTCEHQRQSLTQNHSICLRIYFTSACLCLGRGRFKEEEMKATGLAPVQEKALLWPPLQMTPTASHFNGPASFTPSPSPTPATPSASRSGLCLFCFYLCRCLCTDTLQKPSETSLQPSFPFFFYKWPGYN